MKNEGSLQTVAKILTYAQQSKERLPQSKMLRDCFMEVLEFDLSFEGIEKEVNMRVHISEKEAMVQDKISTTLKWTKMKWIW